MAKLSLRRLLFGSSDIAIDLGTANTLIYVEGRGVVLDEPSLLAVNTTDNSILAVGHEARKLLGKTPDSIKLIRPLRDGVISDIEMAEELLKAFIIKTFGRSLSRPRIIICIPNGVTSVEQRSIEQAAHSTGATEVFTIEEPMAAAIGSNLNIFEANGNMVIDIGGGTTEIAVISMGDIVCSNSIRVGGDRMTFALMDWLQRDHQLLIDEGIAESLKHKVGSAYTFDKEPQVTVTGRDLVEGVPRQVLLEAGDVRDAIDNVVREIVDAIRICLAKTPPALAAVIDKEGAWLAGGGSLLKQFDRRIAEDLGIPVNRTEDPLSTVVLGSGLCLERFPNYRKILKQSSRQ